MNNNNKNINCDMDFPDELLNLEFPQGKRKVKHFKQVVPVSIHHYYLVEDIKEVDFYLDMINTIKTSEGHDTIFIYLNTNGGNLNTTIQIISAMRQSQATIITSLEGQVCSAGTLIFLAGHRHIVNKNCTFMIHNYSQWLGGKGNEIKVQAKYSEAYFKKLATDIYGNFLSEEEIKSVLEDRDIWMESDEVAERVKDKLIPAIDGADTMRQLLENLPAYIDQLSDEDRLIISETVKPKQKPKSIADVVDNEAPPTKKKAVKKKVDKKVQ